MKTEADRQVELAQTWPDEASPKRAFKKKAPQCPRVNQLRGDRLQNSGKARDGQGGVIQVVSQLEQEDVFQRLHAENPAPVKKEMRGGGVQIRQSQERHAEEVGG